MMQPLDKQSISEYFFPSKQTEYQVLVFVAVTHKLTNMNHSQFLTEEEELVLDVFLISGPQDYNVHILTTESWQYVTSINTSHVISGHLHTNLTNSVITLKS